MKAVLKSSIMKKRLAVKVNISFVIIGKTKSTEFTVPTKQVFWLDTLFIDTTSPQETVTSYPCIVTNTAIN